eukprot:TRINITY_DN2044_c4_g1_i1.p1 TRINITY_DN2044_c4_g1~~TRINITY_DN2044_c4_g1_i1.p1  ORF type:complete len:371 (-),score=63.63 TRINITY_DN2044_c4_g1_i1:10-1122(-)
MKRWSLPENGASYLFHVSEAQDFYLFNESIVLPNGVGIGLIVDNEGNAQLVLLCNFHIEIVDSKKLECERYNLYNASYCQQKDMDMSVHVIKSFLLNGDTGAIVVLRHQLLYYKFENLEIILTHAVNIKNTEYYDVAFSNNFLILVYHKNVDILFINSRISLHGNIEIENLVRNKSFKLSIVEYTLAIWVDKEGIFIVDIRTASYQFYPSDFGPVLSILAHPSTESILLALPEHILLKKLNINEVRIMKGIEVQDMTWTSKSHRYYVSHGFHGIVLWDVRDIKPVTRLSGVHYLSSTMNRNFCQYDIHDTRVLIQEDNQLFITNWKPKYATFINVRTTFPPVILRDCVSFNEDWLVYPSNETWVLTTYTL